MPTYNKRHKLATLCITSLFIVGCASPVPIGGLYTDVTLPVGATSSSGGPKQGTAECMSILALLSTGDCSVETAKANGGVTTISHMDWKANNILGIIGKYTLTVYGN